MMDAEPAGLSGRVVERLQSLKRIQQSLRKEDQYGELCNVNSLIDAYRSGALGWNPGLVTYWTEGRQICQPRPFDWDEFEQVKKEVNNERSWWIEGVRSVRCIVGEDADLDGIASWNRATVQVCQVLTASRHSFHALGENSQVMIPKRDMF